MMEENTYVGITLIRGFYIIREEFLLGPEDRLGGFVVIAPARRARDPGSIPGFNNELRKMMRNKIPIYFQSDPHKYQHMLVGL